MRQGPRADSRKDKVSPSCGNYRSRYRLFRQYQILGGAGYHLYEGIGDTIRVSLTGDPVEEIKTAKRILKTLNLRKGGIEVVSCPTCGRTQIGLIALADQVETMVSGYDLDIKVAVMGCAVNGPGEAREADLGIAGGIGEGLLFRKGEIIGKVPEEELLPALKKELDALAGV